MSNGKVHARKSVNPQNCECTDAEYCRAIKYNATMQRMMFQCPVIAAAQG